MKTLVRGFLPLVCLLLLNSTGVYAQDGSALTNGAGIKVVLTAVTVVLLITLITYIFMRTSSIEYKRKIPLFVTAVMGLAVLGGLTGLLAAMALIIVLRDLMGTDINMTLQMVITFAVSGGAVFAADRLAAGRIFAGSGKRLNVLFLLLAAATNAGTIIMVFELINRIMK